MKRKFVAWEDFLRWLLHDDDEDNHIDPIGDGDPQHENPSAGSRDQRRGKNEG
ncbi:hypothetical protein [Paludifilum halophilum]|uniref:hypothetical protein n=1 Tax=Paludifilum halophilum TaxID=1642702 RepID=UPI00146E120B|nr:hypothetical protein [Paludifilum halophilum]